MTGGSLDRSRYSSEFWDLLTDCLIIRHEERPSALDLLSYPVFRRAEIDYLQESCKDSMTLSSEMILEIEIMRAHACKTRLEYF
jgi:serine/threonine protein kinase